VSHLRAVYLTGERIYLRAPTRADVDAAVAWLETPFPVNQPAAEEHLKAEESNPYVPRERHYVIVRRQDDRIVGGVTERVHRALAYELRFHLAPWLDASEADVLRGEALSLLVPWIIGERDAMALAFETAADQPATIAAANALGMRQGARLRRFVARPEGRVDLLIFEALNPDWEGRHA
jgi:RimJ/RimL family protein N-acetyltransferase